MGGLADELEALRKPKGCKVARAVSQLDKDDRVLFEAAMDDEEFSSAGLARILKSRFPVGETAMKLHRSKVCACSPTT